MKKILFVLFAAVIIANTACNKANSTKGTVMHSINAVIGDVSFHEKFGYQPENSSNEELRITTHLSYVENSLRNADNRFLSAAQQLKRGTVLNLLNEYTKLKQFPKNFDFPNQRIPCFIDKLGNICAVGYLIEKTVGRAVAEEINDQFKYEYVLAMNDKTLTQWATDHGLTLEECAMIQPTYDGSPIGNAKNNEGVTTGYRNATLLSSAFNISAGAINAVQLLKQREGKYMPIVGLASGVGQLILGVSNYPKSQTVGGVKMVNHDKVNHSLVNIGLGATTMILSGLNLMQNKTAKETSFRWALQGLPLNNNEIALGVGMSLKL